MNFKLNFITLTLPADQGKVTDQEITRQALQPFLESIKDKYPETSYIWKAERQLNGNIHYHVTTDQFIPHDFIKQSWNQKLKKFGYIKKFADKHGHSHPNSTDVHKTKDIKNFKSYLTKYITKGTQTIEDIVAQLPYRKAAQTPQPNKKGKKLQRVLTREESKIKGKIWDCSINLKKAKRAETEITSGLAAALNNYIDKHDRWGKTLDMCTIIYIHQSEWDEWLPPVIKQSFEEWKAVVRKQTRAPAAEEKQVEAAVEVPF